MQMLHNKETAKSRDGEVLAVFGIYVVGSTIRTVTWKIVVFQDSRLGATCRNSSC